VGTLILIDEDVPVAVEFIELTTNGSGSSMSIAANFGAETDGRKLVIAVHCTGASDLTNAVVGGVNCFPPLVSETGESSLGIHWLLAENVPGTSGNIELDFTGISGARCGIWQATNVESSTPIDTDNKDWGFTNSSQTINPNTEEDGAVFGAVTAQADAPDFTDGVTVEDYSEEFVPTSSIKVAAGFALTPASVIGQNVTAVKGGASTWRGNMAAVSIR
jgi:hypothetical protein